MALNEFADSRTYTYYVTNSHTATRHLFCPWADRFTHKTALIGAAHDDDPNLLCYQVDIKKHSLDPLNYQAELTANYKVKELVELDQEEEDPALGLTNVKWSDATEAITIATKGGAWVWNSGEPITNVESLPIMLLAQAKLVISGVLTAWSLATVTGHIKRVNDGGFQGADAETVLFDSYDVDTYKDADDNTLYRVSYTFLWRKEGWNNFWNETTGAWEEIKRSSDNANVYLTADMSSL